MKASFKISKKERIHITDKYICNGHWLIEKDHAHHRAFKPLLNLSPGSYAFGYEQPPDAPKSDAELERLMPRLPGDEASEDTELTPNDEVRLSYKTNGDIEVRTLILSLPGDDFRVGIDPSYYAMLTGSQELHVNSDLNPKGPLPIVSSDGEIVGCIMPRAIT